MSVIAPVAYGVCGLTPDLLWEMVPADYQALQEARIKYAHENNRFTDLEMAYLKQSIFAVQGIDSLRIDDFKLIREEIEEKNITACDDEEFLLRNKQTLQSWVATTKKVV